MTSGAAVGNPDPSTTAPGGTLLLAACIVKMRYRVRSISSIRPDVVVYTAEDVRSGRPVSLEVVREEFAGDLNFVAAVREQANKLAKSSHVHRGVTQVYESDVTDDGHCFVALQQTHGETLREALSAHGPFDPLTALRIGSQIGEALEMLHHNGILHGELRSDSVLLATDAEGVQHVKLIGVELTAAHRTMIGLRLRDAALEASLAPEQIEHGETTEATDVYSLGRLVQELVTGDRASLDAKDWNGMPEMPAAIHAIIARAVESRPDRRYSNVTLMINDMWSALSELQEPNRHRPTPPRMSDVGRRRWHVPRSVVRAAGTLAIGGFIVGVIAWAAGREGSVSLLRTGTVTPPFTTAPANSRTVQPSLDRAYGERPGSPLPTRDGPGPTSIVAVPTPPSPMPESPLPRPVVSMPTPPVSTHDGPAPKSTVSMPTHDGLKPAPAVALPKPPTPTSAADSRPRPTPKAAPAAAVREQTPRPTAQAPERRPEPVAPTPQPLMGSERPAGDAGDGSAIIDWLLKDRRGN